MGPLCQDPYTAHADSQWKYVGAGNGAYDSAAWRFSTRGWEASLVYLEDHPSGGSVVNNHGDRKSPK